MNKNNKELKNIIGVEVSIVIFFVIVGVIIFRHVEGWEFIDALYYVTATLTTVGYGDITPVTHLGKIFAIVYMWVGVTIVVSSISLIGASFVQRRRDRYQKEKK